MTTFCEALEIGAETNCESCWRSKPHPVLRLANEDALEKRVVRMEPRLWQNPAGPRITYYRVIGEHRHWNSCG